MLECSEERHTCAPPRYVDFSPLVTSSSHIAADAFENKRARLLNAGSRLEQPSPVSLYFFSKCLSKSNATYYDTVRHSEAAAPQATYQREDQSAPSISADAIAKDKAGGKRI